MTHAERMDKDTGGQAVTGSQAPDTFGHSIPFTIDGQPFTTEDPSQKASALLRLAGLDPTNYDLGELWVRTDLRPSATMTTTSLS